MRSHCITGIGALTHWLTPQVWKNAHHAGSSRRSGQRWKLHPLVMVLATMAWTTGDSEAERFATARAFYVACHGREKRPGQSFQGFQKALTKLPLSVLHALFAALRGRLLYLYERYWSHAGFVVMACDGSRQECPRSAELESRLGCCSKADSAPMLYITSLVLLPAGLLWSWCVGPGTASEHDQLRQLLPTLPRCALLVADACYLGYELFSDILKVQAAFLVRVSSRAYLYTETHQPLSQYREGLVYYWPAHAREKGRAPLLLRLLRVVGKRKKGCKKKHDVWLLTSVLEPARLSHQQAAEIYRWRWRIEGVYRTYKRTLPRLKLWSRTEALVYREAEVSLLSLQLLLLQSVAHWRLVHARELVLGSPRETLLRIRGEITTTIGAKLGPRQQQAYRARLARVRAGSSTKKVRRKWPRRKDHKPPKPPKVRVMPKSVKSILNKHLEAA